MSTTTSRSSPQEYSMLERYDPLMRRALSAHENKNRSKPWTDSEEDPFRWSRELNLVLEDKIRKAITNSAGSFPIVRVLPEGHCEPFAVIYDNEENHVRLPPEDAHRLLISKLSLKLKPSEEGGWGNASHIEVLDFQEDLDERIHRSTIGMTMGRPESGNYDVLRGNTQRKACNYTFDAGEVLTGPGYSRAVISLLATEYVWEPKYTRVSPIWLQTEKEYDDLIWQAFTKLTGQPRPKDLHDWGSVLQETLGHSTSTVLSRHSIISIPIKRERYEKESEPHAVLYRPEMDVTFLRDTEEKEAVLGSLTFELIPSEEGIWDDSKDVVLPYPASLATQIQNAHNQWTQCVIPAHRVKDEEWWVDEYATVVKYRFDLGEVDSIPGPSRGIITVRAVKYTLTSVGSSPGDESSPSEECRPSED